MADNGLKVQEAPTEKKKRKSNLKKSEPPKGESAAPAPDSRKASLAAPAPAPDSSKASLAPPAPAPDSSKASLTPPAPAPDSSKASLVTPAPHDDSDPPSKSGSVKREEERRESNPQSQTPKRRASRKAATVLEDLDEAKLSELKEAFKLFDMDQDGFIDSIDLKLTFGTLGRTDVTDEEIQDMLSEASNPLDFDAFVMLLGFKTISLDPEEILLDALGKWDKNNSGLIDEERIKHDLMTWGDKFTSAEVDVALEDAPTFVTDGQRMIDYVMFCKLLCGLRKKTKDVTAEEFYSVLV